MGDPLTDETLAGFARTAAYFDRWYGPGGSEMRALLTEVARLKAREADLIADRDSARAANIDYVECVQSFLLNGADESLWPPGTQDTDALKAYVGHLETEIANLRRELDAATAALEAQGQAAFVAGLRKAPDLDALAGEIAEFVHGFYSDHYGDKPASVQRAREIYWDRPNSMSFTEGQTMAVRTVVREMLGTAMGGGS